MIRLYCRHKEGNKELCGSCRQLTEYAFKKSDNCIFGKNKPVCRKCHIHCYEKEMRKKIIDVMRYSGPRMFFYAPFTAIKHIFKNNNKKQIL